MNEGLNFTEVKNRVAVYLLVLSDNNKQASSYELQKIYYEDYISKHPLWTLVGFYCDEGTSGYTSVKECKGFYDLLNDCKDGKIDVIITKSLTLMGESIADCIKVVKFLSSLENPVGVYFEKEDLYSLNSNGIAYFDFFEKVIEQESRNRTSAKTDSIIDITKHKKKIVKQTIKRGDTKNGNNDK